MAKSGKIFFRLLVQSWRKNAQRRTFQLREKVFHVVDSVCPPGYNGDSVDGGLKVVQV